MYNEIVTGGVTKYPFILADQGMSPETVNESW